MYVNRGPRNAWLGGQGLQRCLCRFTRYSIHPVLSLAANYAWGLWEGVWADFGLKAFFLGGRRGEAWMGRIHGMAYRNFEASKQGFSRDFRVENASGSAPPRLGEGFGSTDGVPERFGLAQPEGT